MATTTNLLVLVFIFGCGAQQLHVAHAPPYIVLQQQDTTLTSSDLHHVIGAPLRLSQQQPSVLKSKSLLKRPKANVLITVLTDTDLPLKSLARYALDMDAPSVNTELLMSSAQRKFMDPLMVELTSQDGHVSVASSNPAIPSPSAEGLQDRLTDADSVLSTLQTTLNHSEPSQGALLGQMQAVQDVVSQLQKVVSSTHRSTPDLLTFTLSGLHSMAATHGLGSPEVSQGSRDLAMFIHGVVDDLRSIYKDHVMIEVLTHPVDKHPHSRKARSLLEDPVATTAKPSELKKKLNLEIDYYPDFPVSFNIVLWLMLILVLVVFFTAYGIWNMNPNLESILYRVPQDEMVKKNN